MASNITIKMIKLQSSDGQVFEVPETVARQSQKIIEHMNYSEAEGIPVEQTAIPVPDVTAEVLAKVITYCEKHTVAKGSSTTPASKEELDYWDEVEFFVGVDEAMLQKLREAAKYLIIEGLIVLTSLKFKDMMKEKNNTEAYEFNCLKK